MHPVLSLLRKYLNIKSMSVQSNLKSFLKAQQLHNEGKDDHESFMLLA